MTVKEKIKLRLVKSKALELRATGQLPFQLVLYIDDLNEKADEKYVRLLMELTQHYLRTKGYYRKYPEVEKQINEELKKIVESSK